MEKQVIIADSTQLEAFVTCERLWNYGHALRLSSHEARPNDAMLQGTLGHKYMERYYKNLSIDETLAYNPDNETCECGCSLQEHPCSTVVNGIGIPGTCLICSIDASLSRSEIDKCNGWTPKPFPLDTLKRNEVKQRFREYCYTYARNDIVPASAETVEVGFSELIYEDDQYLFVLEGRLDISDATIGSMSCIVDHKFQTRKHDIYKKSIQFRNYAMVRRAKMLVINYVRLAKVVNKDTFVRDIASFTDQEHDAWKLELIKIYKRMAQCVYGNYGADLVTYPPGIFDPSWSSCSGRFGYACDFTPLCEELDPTLRQRKQETMYSIKPVWRPW